MICDKDTVIPMRATLGSCGYDFRCPHDVDLVPGEWTMIDTGVSFDGTEVVTGDLLRNGEPVPIQKWFMILTPRSGLGVKYGFRLRNTVGVIDQSYRDPILATVTVEKPLSLKKGDRFMQGIILPYLIFQDEVAPTKERKGGHGSTGLQ